MANMYIPKIYFQEVVFSRIDEKSVLVSGRRYKRYDKTIWQNLPNTHADFSR